MIVQLAALATTGLTLLVGTHLYVARHAEQWSQDEATRRAARVSSGNPTRRSNQ